MQERASEYLYGRQPVREALRSCRREILSLKLREKIRKTPELEEICRIAETLGTEIETSPASWFDRSLGEVNHQGVALGVSRYPYIPSEDLLSSQDSEGDAFCLILDHIEDPQNLGSMLRTANAVGVRDVIIPKDRAVGVTPAVVRASAGASEHTRICQVTNIVRTMKILQEEGLWLAGLDKGPESSLLTEQDLSGAIGLVVGSEGKGLGRLVRETCDYLVEIPMSGNVSSLNAGVATAIALYEIRRQRDKK